MLGKYHPMISLLTLCPPGSQEYPMLLIRMEYYLDNKYRKVEDLPVDIQNNILRNYCC
jgi:hypothetical protein